MPRFDYEAEMRPWTAAANNISSAMIQLPALRAQLARQRQNDAEMAAVRQAQTQHYLAETAKTKQETAGLEQDQGGDLQISKALRTLGVNPNDTNAAADLFEGVGKSFRHNPKQTSEAVGMLMSTLLARSGSTNFQQMGALQGDAASIANNLSNVGSREKIATEANAVKERIAGNDLAMKERLARTKPITVSRDSGVYDPANDKWMVNRPDRPTGNAENLYDPATRTALSKLGEQYAAAALDDGSETNLPPIQAQIDVLKSRARGGAAPLPERPVRTSQPNFPTRAIARQYVDQYGAKAKAKLQADGYDVTGYAD